jgi:hypothetical protein
MCPIVAVPENYDCDLPEEVDYSTDFNHNFIAPELAALIAISKLWDAVVSVVHIQCQK